MPLNKETKSNLNVVNFTEEVINRDYCLLLYMFQTNNYWSFQEPEHCQRDLLY